MKTRLSLAVATAALLTALFGAVPSAKAATPSYTGCLSPILNVVYDVAPGDLPAHPPCLRPANMIHLSSGDLTSLTAGTGLTGGGDNGDLSIGIAPTYRLPQGCSSGQTAGWNGTAWACAAFTSQADFNSLVALLGTPGTINDGSNPVHWTKLKGVPAGFADGVDNVGPSYTAGFGLNLASQTFSVDPAQVQRRITGSCPAGSSIGEIAQDGSVTCRGHASYTAGEGLALSGNTFSLDDNGVTSAKLHDNAVGTGKIADSAVTEGKLSFDPATQTELDTGLGSLNAGNLTSGTVPNDRIGGTYSNEVSFTNALNSFTGSFTGDGSGLTGVNASVATSTGLSGSGAVGDPLHVASSYQVPQSCTSGQVPKWNGSAWACANDDLASGGGGGNTLQAFCAFARVNPRSSAPCRGRTVDSAGFVGTFTSLALGTDGNPVVSYTGNAGTLIVARCNDPACAGGDETLSTVDRFTGSDTSLAIGTDGNPVVSYYDGANADRDLKVARCNDPACAGGNETLSTVDSAGAVGSYTSLAIGTDGNPVVSYQDASNGDLKVARCNDPACAGGNETLSTVDDSTGLFVGVYTSLAIGTDGNPVVSYQDGTSRDLKVARCNDPACAGGDESLSTVDSAGLVGEYTSLAIGTDGNPVVSYYDQTNNDLKVARAPIG